MVFRTCLTLSGDSYWAVVNSVWSLLQEAAFIPDRLILLTHGPHKDVAARSAGTVQKLLASFGRPSDPEVVVVPETDLKASHDLLLRIMREAKGAGEVALNITPARKSLAAVAIVAAWETNVDRVYYLYLRDMKSKDHAYPLIPCDLQDLVDLRELRPS